MRRGPCFIKENSRTPHAVSTFIPQAGYLFSSFDRAQHGTAAQQHNENETGKSGKKIPVSSCTIFWPDWDTLPRSNRGKIEHQSFSLSLVRPPVSRPSHHRLDPSKMSPPLCHSEPRRPPCVGPSAHRCPRLPARQSWCSDCVAPSANFSLDAEISTAGILFCNPERPLLFYPISQMAARHSPFIFPRCLGAHATPSHENGDRVSCNPTSTRQHPLTPATAPGSPAVPRVLSTRTHTK